MGPTILTQACEAISDMAHTGPHIHVVFLIFHAHAMLHAWSI